MKRCSTLLIIQNTNQNHSKIPPHWIATIKKSIDSKYQWKCEKRDPCMLLWRMWTGAATMKNSMAAAQKTKSRGVPGGSEVMTLPSNAGDMVSIPDPGGSYELQSPTMPVCHKYWACALEPTSCSCWAPHPRARPVQEEKLPHEEARAPQLESSPTHSTEKSPQRNGPSTAK